MVTTPSPVPSLAGKVALVTGGSSGIGRASAIAFAAADATVVVADVDDTGGQETVRRIADAGSTGLFLHADVARASEVEAMIEQTVATYGRLDCAHNNAGIEGPLGSLIDCTEEEWDRVIGVNLKGVWLCLKYEIPRMLEQGGGVIVNTASVAGLVGSLAVPIYGASKHGVVGLTRSAALTYAKSGIRVNAVCPGYIQTPMLHRHPELEARALAREPIGRLGTPEEVAAAVVWLCSDAASFVTGHALVIDGALLA
jgi:NAD(P)-dependent dehydrogenase (short-subunit alcohol dehydrogenase family)